MPVLRQPLSDPLIETVLIEDERIRMFDRHLSRLRRSGASGSQVTAVQTLAETWRRTARTPTVVRFDVAPDRGVSSTPRAPASTKPVRLVTLPGYDPEDARREHKHADRRWAESAETEAARRGADEPLLVSPDGLVGETSRASFFALHRDGRITTPPVRGLLPGVTRSWLVASGAVDEDELRIEDLPALRAAFVTTAIRGVVPVATLDGRSLPTDDARVADLARRWRELP